MAVARTQAPAKRARAASSRGTGAGEYKVKGVRATARQRNTINGCLEEADRLGAARRVLVAVVMAITQESVAGEKQGRTGNDDLGIYHQGRNWISEAGAKDPARATRAFLVTGPTSWKKVHGGLKKAPGNLSLAIHKVQGNRDPNAYAQWEDEATNTVDTWLGEGGHGGSYIKRYTFTRGERHGEHEDSWEAADRLVKEVGAFRWAAGNTFYAVSADELHQQAPSLTIHGDEPWLRKDPAWSWGSRRSIHEMTLEVLADRWDVMPGGLVLLDRKLGAMSGRWLVYTVSGQSLDSPEATVVLRRPTSLRKEPASERVDRSDDGKGGKLRDVCREISDHRSDYKYGGGHDKAVRKLKSSDRLDCSSAVSLALYRAGYFDGDKIAYTSGTFAAQWGSKGKGDEFTVWANAEHVWIEFDDGARFDTSQHSGKSGPMYTTVKRTDQGRFTPRHHST